MKTKFLKVMPIALCVASLVMVLAQPALAGHRSKKAQNVETLDRVVAVVNDEVITERELQKRIGFYKLEANDSALVPPMNVLRIQALNLLIEQTVALHTAARVGIDVDTDSIKETVNGLLKRNKLTEKQLKELLSQQNLTFADYQDMVRKEMLVQQLLQREVGGRIQIPKQEVDKYLNSFAYDQNNVTEYLLSDILIALPEVPSSHDMQKANNKADAVMKKLKSGANFKELAQKYSNAPNALQGGDMGWRRIEEIPTIFAEKIESMHAGEYIGPIKTPNGLHILKLQDVKGAKVRHVITEYKTRHILIKVAIVDDEDSIKARLVELRKRVSDGESFKDLAKQYSQDPVSAAKGGSLGWVPPGVMVAEFEKIMSSQKIGEISEPFRSEYGWHILLVEDKRQKDNTTEYYANELRKKIYQRKFAEEAQNFLRRLRSTAYIENKLNEKSKNQLQYG